MSDFSKRRRGAAIRSAGLVLGLTLAIGARMVAVQLGGTYRDDPANAFVRGAVETDRRLPPIETADGRLVAESTRADGRWIRRYARPDLTALVGVVPLGGFPVGIERVVASSPATESAPIRLTVVGSMQDHAVQALDGRTGSLLVLALDGSVLAAADSTPLVTSANALADGSVRGSSPWARGAEPPSFWRPTAPGSTLKPLLFAAAVDAGVTSPREVLPARTGFAPPGGRRISNDDGFLCPSGTLVSSIALSCNSTSVDLAARLGAARVRASFARFGFGRAMPAGFAAAAAPLGSTWPTDIDEVSLAAIGQGEARVTVLELGLAYAGLVTGRPVPEPRLFESDPVATSGGPPVSSLARETALAGMREAVAHGTARRLAGTDVAVKTGTATRDSRHRSDGWAVGLVPADHPRAIVIVRIDGLPASASGRDAVGVLGAFLAIDDPSEER